MAHVSPGHGRIILISSLLVLVALTLQNVFWRSRAVSAQQMVHTRPSIDGAENPDLIPDETAYSLLFRMLTPGEGIDGEYRTRKLIKAMFVPPASDKPGTVSLTDSEVEAVFVVVSKYVSEAEAIDAEKLEATRTLQVGKLPAISARHAALVSSFRFDMDRGLEPRLAGRIRRFVNEVAKKQMKIIY